MKVLCLVSWFEQRRWLWDYLPDKSDQVDFVTISKPADRFPGYGKLLGYYQKYFWLALKAWPKVRHYDLVVAWEGKNGVPLALLRSLLGRRNPPMVILNFVLKTRPVLDFLWLIRFAVHSVDCLGTVSYQEIEHYSQQLRLPQHRFARLLTTHPDHYGKHLAEVPRDNPYILAAGRSHRDYGTLVRAVRGLSLKVAINARPFNVKGFDLPDNVVFNGWMPAQAFHELVRNAAFVVLPLFEAKHASGETFLLEAMSAQKAVIATQTYSTVEFIEHGHNGLLVPPGDITAMRRAIEYLASNPDEATRMGLSARRFYEENCSMPAYARRAHRLLQTIVEEPRTGRRHP